MSREPGARKFREKLGEAICITIGVLSGIVIVVLLAAYVTGNWV